MAVVNEPNLIEDRAKGDRFWDQYVTQQFTTTTGFKAIYAPTIGGSNTTWQNREVMFAVEIQYADGRSEVRNIAAGIFESVTTKRSSPLATIKISSLANPMKQANAEKVKDGSLWYENREVSYVLNKLLESVFKTKDGYLADNKRLSRELIKIPTLDSKLDYWALGIPPYWDGSTFKPSETAFPVTALTVNEARNVIYVGLGGMDGTNFGESWQFEIDLNLWTRLGTTGAVSPSDPTTTNSAIRQLFFNTNDEMLYGVLWYDWGEQGLAEAIPNKTNWIAPKARLFWVDPSDITGVYLNNAAISIDLGNIWTGQWDIREMWRHDSSSEIGIKKDGGPGPSAGGGDEKNDANVHKLEARASVGNFSAFKYISVPFGPIGQQGGYSNIESEARRAAHKYHPQPSRDDYEDDPLMQTWGNTDHGTAKGELMPRTSAGESIWTGASGTTPPNGWTRAGSSATFTKSGDVLTVSNVGSDSTDGLNIKLNNIEDNMTTYRLRIDGGANWELYISNSAFGTNSMPYGPIGPTNSVGYSSTYYGTGDYYFGVLSTNAIANWSANDDLYLSLRRRAGYTGSSFTIDNISLTVARYWDKWWGKDLDLRQAGENIPLTSYGKIMAGCTVKYPPHQMTSELTRQAGNWDGPQAAIYFDADAGPSWNDYDLDVPGSVVLDQPETSTDPDTYWTGKQRNEDIFCEFNLVAQDRRFLPGADWDTIAYNPMYGPSEAEDGISPDNSKRFSVGSKNIVPEPTAGIGVAFSSSSYSNQMCVADLGPRVSSTSPSAWTGQEELVVDRISMQTGQGGYGYASVQIQAVGDRAMDSTVSDDYELSGIVRYTNGQQGFFVFSQEADDGKGVILYASFDDTDGPPPDNNRFDWGPNKGSGYRFEIKYHAITCNGTSNPTIDKDYTLHAASVGSGKIPTRRTLTAQTPYLTAGDNWTAIYPTAGCADDLGNFYIGAIDSCPAHTALYTGANESSVHAQSYIYKLAAGTGAFPASGGTSTALYSSASDASVYNVDPENPTDTCLGNLNNDYAAATAESSSVNYTRKICWLHFNPHMAAGSQICGWSFRRDSILADPAGAGVGSLAIPCHEVFITDGTTTNELTIVDHDVADGLNMNAVGFVGFCNSSGAIGSTTTEVGTQSATWYFRQKKPTIFSQTTELIGQGIQINYMFNNDSGYLIGGQFWDDKTTAALSRKVKGDEGFIGSKVAVVAIKDFSLDTEREAIFSSFDHYIDWNHISNIWRSNPVWTSTKQFFKIDDFDVDPILALYDFTGLKVYEAITRLAWAHNFVFGFDIDKFFIVSRDLQEITHTLKAEDGDILDITKTIDNEIRNVISIQPYIPQVQDIDWEITHVGEVDEELADPTLYHGDMVLQVNTHREVSLNLICTRKGRLILDQFGEDDVENPGQVLGDPTTAWIGELRDAIDDPEDRMVPMFKFKVNAPTKIVVLMHKIGVDSTEIYINTTFAGGLSPIVPGDILIFSNPETFEQVGRVITTVDTVNNVITIEESPGFVVEKSAPLNIASANTGDRITQTGNIDQSSYGTTYSDEGVCVVTAFNHEESVINAGIAEGEDPTFTATSLTVNNLSPFRGFHFTPYNTEEYKHYSFLVTTANTATINSSSTTLPAGAVGTVDETGVMAWIYKVGIDDMKIYLNGVYNHFKIGDVLNIHYCMQPANLIKKIQGGAYEPPPYESVLQDLPEGLASWHWVVDEVTDLFNVGDIINFKFRGIKLVKDSASIYTGADMTSINRYGEKPWTFPDNRFMSHNRVEYWVSKYLQEYSHPKMIIDAVIPYDGDIGFMNPAGNLLRSIKIIDDVMFPGIANFSVTGYIIKLGVDLKNFKMHLKFRTEEKY